MSGLKLNIDPESELKLLEKEDASEYFGLMDRNREFFSGWITNPKWYSSPEAASDKVADIVGQQDRQERMHFCIWHKGQLVGAIGLHHIDLESCNAELGYYLDENYQGRGLVTRGCAIILEYAFKNLKLHRIQSQSGDGNSKSSAVLERLGFKYEGTLREAYLLNGRYVDVKQYSLLDREWKL